MTYIRLGTLIKDPQNPLFYLWNAFHKCSYINFVTFLTVLYTFVQPNIYNDKRRGFGNARQANQNI